VATHVSLIASPGSSVTESWLGLGAFPEDGDGDRTWSASPELQLFEQELVLIKEVPGPCISCSLPVIPVRLSSPPRSVESDHTPITFLWT
jgi:hypothetical protein